MIKQSVISVSRNELQHNLLKIKVGLPLRSVSHSKFQVCKLIIILQWHAEKPLALNVDGEKTLFKTLSKVKS